MTTDQRLQYLERQCRIYRNLFILAGLAVVALVTWGATKPVPEVIKAMRFEVITPTGDTTVIMGSNPGGGALYLFNLTGQPGLVATVEHPEGGVISLRKAGIAGGVYLYANRPGTLTTGGVIAVKNTFGEEVVLLRADEYGNGVVGAYNRKGEGRTLRPGPQ